MHGLIMDIRIGRWDVARQVPKGLIGIVQHAVAAADEVFALVPY